VNEIFSPSSVYMRGKEPNYVGLCPYRKPTIIRCRLTHAKCYTPRVHMSSCKVMSYTSKAPNASVLNEVCPTLLVQATKVSINPPKLCTPSGPLSLHEHCCNPSVLEPTQSLHTRIQATLCYLGHNALRQDVKHSCS